MAVDQINAGIHRCHMIAGTPVPCKRGIEHYAKPMQDDRLFRLAKDAVIYTEIVIWRMCGSHQRTARHQYDAASKRFNKLYLFLVRANYIVDCDTRAGD